MTEPSKTDTTTARSLVTEEPPAKRGVNRALAIVVACVLLFLWGFSSGATAPDGKWLLAVLILGATLAGFVFAGRRYVRRERVDAARTAELEQGMQQDTSGDHIWDGA